MDNLHTRVNQALIQVRNALDQACAKNGHWTGELSSSALSTATAVAALGIVDRETSSGRHAEFVRKGLQWLAGHANPDGGWGDTTRSLSNISTTALCWAAFGVAPDLSGRFADTIGRAEGWLAKEAGGLQPGSLANAIIARYGDDRTFSVPILTMCALCGRLGEGSAAWTRVIPLPFELAALPHSWFAALRLPVVSYALPALIAIGQARHHHRPSLNPIVRWTRGLIRKRTLEKLISLQPDNGGFLEATPLTSFVTLSLAGSEHARHPVAVKGAEFLRASMRRDGSWPIDTNLSTWVTTQAVNGLANDSDWIWSGQRPDQLKAWLLKQQYREVHPYTRAAPGGWAWTDLPGGVPDADDTPGALLALRHLGGRGESVTYSVESGVRWLLDLQNRDGGIPTFCRGWGKLPFDRSSPDLTAHCLRAWHAWRRDLPPALNESVRQAMKRAFAFLARTQRPDGSWMPLWFGNQHVRDELNPWYGTAKVLTAISECADETGADAAAGMIRKALSWIFNHQNADGSWGRNLPGRAPYPIDRPPPHDLPSGQVAGTIEETAWILEALFKAFMRREVENDFDPHRKQSLRRGLDWLLDRVESDAWRDPAPIGFYFAKLWYFEKLYPLTSTVAAISACKAWMGKSREKKELDVILSDSIQRPPI